MIRRLHGIARYGCVALLLSSFFALAQEPSEKGKPAWAVYSEYRAALAKATAIDQLIPYFVKERAEEMSQAPEEDHQFFLEMLQLMNEGIRDLQVVGETWESANEVVFEISAKQDDEAGTSDMTGEVSMSKEDGAWKVGKERFSIKGD